MQRHQSLRRRSVSTSAPDPDFPDHNNSATYDLQLCVAMSEGISDKTMTISDEPANQHHCLVLAAARSQWPIVAAGEPPLFIPVPPDEAFLNDPSVSDLERCWWHIRQFATIDSEVLPDVGEHADLLQCLREKCKRLLPQLMPPNFPPSLRPLVADSQKTEALSDRALEPLLPRAHQALLGGHP
jgi:hypothetical protein